MNSGIMVNARDVVGGPLVEASEKQCLVWRMNGNWGASES